MVFPPIILNDSALEPTFDAAGQRRSHLCFSALLTAATFIFCGRDIGLGISDYINVKKLFLVEFP